MLQMRVYSERTVDKDGIITKTGEDAFPYVNEAGMFVADGMGGGAGVAIISFPPDCFDEERFAERLTESARLDQAGIDEFSAYVKQNFSSLMNPAMKQLYENPSKNILRLKKSGYVGSHALGLTMAAFLIPLAAYKSKLSDASQWENQVLNIKDALFDSYKQAIDLIGAECAKVSLNKIDYYGTTLAAAFFRETPDSVDVIFFNCGDSRSYVWDEKGFRQACDDQGRNGGMTSRFSLGEDADVRIFCEKRSYRKPCSIFCMTDGIYGAFGGKNGFHSSPLYMEGFLMNTLSAVNSLEEAQQRLKKVFDEKGQFDDSNSMVMASFGYASYQELKAAASARMNYLNSAYSLRTQPDDFLLEDYQERVKKLRQEAAGQLMPLLQKAYQSAAIQKYCKGRIKSRALCEKYCAELHKIDEKIKEVSLKNEEIRGSLCGIAEKNFLDFVDWNEFERPRIPRLVGGRINSPCEKAKSAGRAYRNHLTGRDAAISQFIKCAQTANDEICNSIESIRIGSDQAWTEDQERNSRQWARKAEVQIGTMSSELAALSRSIAELSQSITSDRRQWQEANIKAKTNYFCKGGTVSVEKLVSEWISDVCIEVTLPATTIPAIRSEIVDLAKHYQENLEQIQQLRADFDIAFDRAAKKYWEENASRDIDSLLERGTYFADCPKLEREIADGMGQNEELKRFQLLCDKQRDVFTRYLDEHLADVSSEKRADVEKCGWM